MVPRNIRAVLALAIATIASIGVLWILPLDPPIRYLPPFAIAVGVLPPIPRVEAVRAALVNGLSECHRLAREAYEATRTRYWDSQGIVILAGVLATGLLLLVSVWVSPEPDAVRRVLGAIPLAV